MATTRLAVYGFAAILVIITLAAADPAAAQGAAQRCTEAGPARFFWHYDCVGAEFARIQAEHSEIASATVIGQSVEGREIHLLHVTGPDQANITSKPGFYLDATHHGNEVQGTEAAMRLARLITSQYGSNETITRWVDNYNIWINPVVNPDGNVRNARANANGVDLNRNYPYEWCVRASACGPSAASEPETKANVEFMSTNDIDVYVSLHTGTYDHVVPRCSKDVSQARVDTDDVELYDVVEAELLAATRGYQMAGFRGASGTGESICWAYDAAAIFSLLPEVTQEQNVLFSAGETRELEGAMLAIYWLVEHTGRFGAVLEPELVYNATNPSGIAIKLTNTGLQTALNWTMDVWGSKSTSPPLLRGNEPIAPGSSLTVGIPKQLLAGNVTAEIKFDHLNVNPLSQAGEDGIVRDPRVTWLNFTQEQAQQVVRDGSGDTGAEPADVPAAGVFAVMAALGLAALRRRRP